MKSVKCVAVAGVTVLLASCASTVNILPPTHVIAMVLHEDSRLSFEGPECFPPIRVEDGTNTILELTHRDYMLYFTGDGREDTFFIVLPCHITGTTYHVSADAGTLVYQGWRAHAVMRAIPASECVGTVDVHFQDSGYVRAIVDVSASALEMVLYPTKSRVAAKGEFDFFGDGGKTYNVNVKKSRSRSQVQRASWVHH